MKQLSAFTLALGVTTASAAAHAAPPCERTNNRPGDVEVVVADPQTRRQTTADPADERLVTRTDEGLTISMARATTERLDCVRPPDPLFLQAHAEALGAGTTAWARAEMRMNGYQSVMLEAGYVGVIPVRTDACGTHAEAPQRLLDCERAARAPGGVGSVVARATYRVTVNGRTAVEIPLEVTTDGNGFTQARVDEGYRRLAGFRAERLPGDGAFFVWDDTSFALPRGNVRVTLATEAESTVECTPGGQCLVGVADLTDPPIRSTKTGGIGE